MNVPVDIYGRYRFYKNMESDLNFVSVSSCGMGLDVPVSSLSSIALAATLQISMASFMFHVYEYM